VLWLTLVLGTEARDELGRIEERLAAGAIEPLVIALVEVPGPELYPDVVDGVENEGPAEPSRTLAGAPCSEAQRQ